jgi:hypothetical protein
MMAECWCASPIIARQNREKQAVRAICRAWRHRARWGYRLCAASMDVIRARWEQRLCGRVLVHAAARRRALQCIIAGITRGALCATMCLNPVAVTPARPRM